MKDSGERLIAEGNERTLTYGEHLSRYLSVVDLVKNKTVLDVASGSGYGSYLLAQTARKVIGADNSEEAVDYSTKKYVRKNLSFINSDAENLEKIASGTIDVVVSFETIEHLNDPSKFISEVKRVLVAGGSFIASTPNDDEFMEGNQFHVHEFTLSELNRLLKKNFASSTFYYQGTWFSTGILSEEQFSGPIDSQSLEVTKTIGELPKKSVFFITVSSDSKLPKLKGNVVLADTWRTKDDQARHAVHLREIEDMHKLHDENLKLNELNRHLSNELQHITNTKWWKARAPLRGIKRKVKGK